MKQSQSLETYRQQFSKTLNLGGIAWWIIDYENDPSHFICNDEMVRSFSLDPNLERHSIALSCPIAGDYNTNIADSAARRKVFADYERMLIGKTAEYLNDFPYTNPTTRAVKYFRSRAVMLERKENGEAAIAYGIIEDITPEITKRELFKQQAAELEQFIKNRDSLIEQLAKSERMLKKAAEFARINLFIVDVETGNGEMLFNTNDQTAYLPTKEWLEYVTPAYKEIARQVLDSGPEFGSAEYEVKLKGPDAPSTWLQQAVLDEYEGEDGRRVRFSVSRDITRRMEERQRLRSLLEKQKEMFAVISHELRTPVAAINMLTLDEHHSDEEKVREIQGLSEGLLSILEDLRIIVAPERALESKLIDENPYTIIQRALAPLSGVLKTENKKLNINLNTAQDKHFLVHAQPLRQTVTNLVKNAAIHSQGLNVSVSFQCEGISDTEHQASLIIEDDGRGIPEDQIESLMQPFSRGDTQASGSGLGLFIVSELVKVMGGTLDYSTSELGGACFTIRFPLQLASPTEVTPTPQTAIDQTRVNLEGLRILLAEDDTMLRMLTERTLSNRGAKVESFENGRLALEEFDSAEKEQYDLVLTDLMMPELDGHGLTKALRQRDTAIPIIAVTAAVVGEETEEVLRKGANAFISKPISADKLIDTLTRIHGGSLV